MIPDSAIEAAHKAWREQAKQDGTIFEYNLRAAIEAAAPQILAELRSHVADQILAANNAEGFTEFAAGWVAALKNVHERLPK